MIRKARMDDVKEMQRLIDAYAKKGEMLQRSLLELYENIRDYSVYAGDAGGIIGVCAVHMFWDGLAEIRSLAVREEYTHKGIGTALARSCIEEARGFGINQLFSLTYKPGFFEKLGFRIVDKSLLPQKIWSDCLKCPQFPDCNEIALIMDLNGAPDGKR
ncbi:MAG: N-acetyltransferase [Deltaproteobacteria bacterium]|nr:N-acetyltransferase [Deltaproteobacteria bacterium]MCL5277974.1 N-acetyltransferase [Deltaproteobacteria bacterium]